MNIQGWFPLGFTGLISLSRGLSRVFSSTTVWKHKFFRAQLSLWYDSHIHSWLLENHSFDYMDLCWQSNVSSVQSLSRVRLFVTPWTTARLPVHHQLPETSQRPDGQASLSITNSQRPPKPMSIKSVMPSNHLILCRPLLLLPSTFPSIRVFSNELALRIRWPKNWSFSFSISPSNEHPGLISCRMDWLNLLAVQGTLKSFIQYHSPKSINSLMLSFF